jgi:hypothetical protein
MYSDSFHASAIGSLFALSFVSSRSAESPQGRTGVALTLITIES